MMKDYEFQLLRGFDDKRSDRQTDISKFRVAFATEKHKTFLLTWLTHILREL